MQTYKSKFANFMEPITGKKANTDTSFTDTELLRITPGDIVRFLRLKAYGKTDPDSYNFKILVVICSMTLLFVSLKLEQEHSYEREFPDQIILGSMNPIMCPLPNLASFVETTPLITLQRKGKTRF